VRKAGAYKSLQIRMMGRRSGPDADDLDLEERFFFMLSVEFEED
jgi:hypothetical protein